MGPWLLRNTLTFGAPFPSSALSLALLPDYPTLFHYGQPSYWDGLPPPDWGRLLALRPDGLSHNLFVLFVQSLFPLAPFALFGGWSLRGTPVIAVGLAFGALLFFTSALLFPVATMHGTFYHSVGAVLPFLTVAAAWGLYRFGSFWGGRLFNDPVFMGAAVCVAVFVLVVAQVGLSASAASALHARLADDVSSANLWLEEQGVSGTVMSTQPHSLGYASGLPAIALPASDPPEVTRAVALKYHVRYIVGFGRFGLYPEALQEQTEFSLVYQREDVWIYRVE